MWVYSIFNIIKYLLLCPPLPVLRDADENFTERSSLFRPAGKPCGRPFENGYRASTSATRRRLASHTEPLFPLCSDSLTATCRDMRMAPPSTPHTLVRFMLTYPLDIDPGACSVHSNVGYLYSGVHFRFCKRRVSRKIRSKPDSAAPGNLDMHTGGSTHQSRGPGEVCYYSAFDATFDAQFDSRRG